MTQLSQESKHKITMTLNGREQSGYAEPRMLLSDFLRDALGLTGTHVGCEHGVCGACTVLVDGEAVPAIGPVGAVRRGVALDTERLREGTASDK